MLRSRLKEIADKRNISIREISRDIDHSFEVVRRMYNDTMERYPRDLLDKLCAYLGVTTGELLEYVETKKSPE